LINQNYLISLLLIATLIKDTMSEEKEKMASSLLVPDGRRGTSTAGSVGRMLSFKASGGSAAGRAR
jgi:hypothetical protein